MKTFNYALAGALVFFAGTNLWAIPAGFNIQGRLTDANGVNKDGTFQIKFSVFTNDVGSPVWEKNMPSVSVKNGNFQVILQGADDNSVQLENAVKDLEAAYVEIKVGTEPPLVPRQPLLRSPFSSSDKVVGKTDVLISAGSGNIVMKTGNDDRLTILNNGNVGVGTTSPTEKLSVDGTVESKNGGFKFPDGSIQTIALSGCTFRLKPVGCGRFPGNTESIASCSIYPDLILVVNSHGFSWQMDFSVCYTCAGAPEVCGPPTHIAQVEFD